ncbi:MAG TPA: hypothetical protein VF177_09535 [Anaerolineae bacterium]
MLAVRGTYDGKTFRSSPSEKLPDISGEIPVAIIFLEPLLEDQQQQQRQREAAKWMRAKRAQMAPLDISIKDMIEEGREQ